MLKKILLVLLILAPSALYIYVISRDDKTAENQAETTPAEKHRLSNTRLPITSF
jgi:hypothetical protein